MSIIILLHKHIEKRKWANTLLQNHTTASPTTPTLIHYVMRLWGYYVTSPDVLTGFRFRLDGDWYRPRIHSPWFACIECCLLLANGNKHYFFISLTFKELFTALTISYKYMINNTAIISSTENLYIYKHAFIKWVCIIPIYELLQQIYLDKKFHICWRKNWPPDWLTVWLIHSMIH